MECVWDAALLQRAAELPPGLLQIIRSANNKQYLAAITKTTLDSRYTYLIFAHCEDIFTHICATLRTHGSFASAVATLGRIIPIAPYLKPYAQRLFSHDQYEFSASRGSDDDLLYLLGLFRLFSADWRTFKPFIKPTTISELLESPSRPIVYLAIRILQIYLSGADHWFEQMIKRYLGDDTPESGIDGAWDDRTIDYRFLTLWEEDRFRNAVKLVEDVRAGVPAGKKGSARVLPSDCFDDSTCLVGGTLLPRSLKPATEVRSSDDGLVHTSTAQNNLRKVASALKSPRPILLTGLAGSGKTLLVRHLARKLGALDKMITLHLNEQSDAKLLIGVYTTGDTPGSFKWKPGVLTQAVQEGRWVLIEDLDRAPNEIIGTLLPLIEKGELLIQNRKQTIHATQGFRILATTRSQMNHRGQETTPLAHMLGARHWQNVAIGSANINELAFIVDQLHPTLSLLRPQMIKVYERLQVFRQRAVLVGQSKTGILRPISPRDLLKWCARVANLLQTRSTFTSQDVDDIFLEAVDSFVGALPDGSARDGMAAVIAEELQIDPQRRDYLLTDREAKYDAGKATISIGRYSLPRSQEARKNPTSQETFSTNPHTCRMLERVAAAVLNREPLLLVGETGVGKTTAVQHLATHLGKKLVPFNLSQQSEAGDLLGGFKPVDARSIIVPMKDEFDELFSAGFSRSKNQQFLDLLSKQMARSNWKAVCKLWRQALKMADDQRSAINNRQGEGPSKKRKVEPKKTLDLPRWESFAAKLSGLERRLAAGDNAFAFNFVEGTIVKAVRNGDWVLLDEINLASPDTLEAITDLLDPNNPSVLLTESGSVERVDAHSDFRVFAAMNPATDVGKKDLPPGVRSRFTELYVETPDKDIKSLQSIVRSYLRHETANDPAVPPDVGALYQKIIGFGNNNQLVDGAGQKPHFSLRTLTRTLSYAKYIAPLCSLRRALYEGFHMSFLTFLDAESCRLVEPLLEQYLLGKRTNIRAELSKPLRQPSDGFAHVQGYPGSKHWIRQGTFEIEDQPHYILTPFIRRNLESLVRASSTRRFPVLIQGPTSSGKTSMIEYLAKRSGHKFVRINNHEHTDLQEYLGTYVSGADGRLQFQEGVLIKALREGHWIVLDELNLAPTDVLEALNRLLDDNRELLIPETQEVVRPHESFMLFATQNPAGLYGGRKTLSRAFRNRFLELHFDDIPIDELQEILHKRTQQPESRCKRIVAVYKELSVLRQENRVFEQRSFATLRDLFRWAFRPNDTIEHLAANGFMLLGERVRKQEERQVLKEIIERVMSTNGPRVRIDEDALYATNASEVTQYEQHGGSQGVVWTRAMRRLYCLVSRAIHNNEPVLLVGETGCGKTTVCQMLADALSKKLHTVNAHQNTETGDIIGSQRPVRNRAGIEASLRHSLLSSSSLQSLDTAAAHSTESLLEAYDHVITSLSAAEKASHHQTPEHAEILLHRTRFKALFEWADGSLVQAMKEGSFFLLDEISLADDSVLERINSVLESQRSILLAEKGSLDSFVSAAPEFQFFATMNPGGDYGKRELSPALRNRFTEIWVPPLSNVDDVTQIVQHKLTEAARPHTTAVVGFAQWFNEQYNTSASSSISIRDTLSWVSFVNAFAIDDVGAAVVHGAAMVYIDTLGANPAGLMTMSTGSLDQERIRCVETLCQLLRIDAHAVYSSPTEVQVGEDGLRIGRFCISRQSTGQVADSTFSFEPPTTKINAMRVVRAMQLTKPVLLEGSPGVGKTALVTAIADAVGMPLTRINLSEQTDLLDLFGSDVPVEGSTTGTFAWRDASFLRAMKHGEWVLLDEMNLASQSVLEGLNACLDHRGEVFVPELGQTFVRHPNFRLFAAQNPHHQGGGRKGLPASFVNRFTVVFADAFRAEDLALISTRLFPAVEPRVIEHVVSFVEQLEREVVQSRRIGANGGPWEFNLRDVSRWLSLASSDRGLLQSATAHDFIDLLFSQRFRSEADRSFITSLFARMFGNSEAASDLFPNMSSAALQIGVGLLNRNISSATPKQLVPSAPGSHDHLAIVQSIMLCLQRSWPIILTGAPGVGKTTTIDRLATAVGAEVTTIAMNADTDAMDLIGGFEQADPQRRLTHAHKQLQSLLHMQARKSLTTDVAAELARLLEKPDVESLAAQLSQHQASSGVFTADQVSDISALLHDLKASEQDVEKARFEWIDGLLVDTLREGKWLVLENANLCNPSVLDRLNSLLEPNGSLIINEHTTEDGAARVLQPHPDFRVFLTYDPRYGELSRAMRNRAVELHLPNAGGELSYDRADALHPESAVARLRNARLLKLDASSDITSVDAIRVLTDHSSIADIPLVQRFLAQLTGGLYGLSETTLRDLDPVWSTACQAASESSAVVEQLSEPAVDQAQESADYKNVQTLHPLNNQALIRNAPASLSRAHSAAFTFDIITQASVLAATVESIQLNGTQLGAIRQVERSYRAYSKQTSNDMKGSLVLRSLLDALRILVDLSQRTDVAATVIQLRPVATTLFASWDVLLHYLSSGVLDVTTLATYLVSSANILQAKVTEAPSAYAFQLSEIGATSLSVLGKAANDDHRTCSTLWKALRPITPSTKDQLNSLLHLESLADQFDCICRSFALPLDTMTELHVSFARTLALAQSGDRDATRLSTALDVVMSEQAGPLTDTDDEQGAHFAHTFRRLLERFAMLRLNGRELSSQELARLEILASRKTDAGVLRVVQQSERTIQTQLGLLQIIVGPLLQRLTESLSSPTTLIEQVQTVGNVSMGRMRLLEDEVDLLGKVFGSQAHNFEQRDIDLLQPTLRALVTSVLSALSGDASDEESRRSARQLLKCLAQPSDSTVNGHSYGDLGEGAPANVDEKLRSAFAKFDLAISYLSSDTNSANESQAVESWAAFAVACIQLYVPTTPFDPALEVRFRHDALHTAREQLRSQLGALRALRRALTGRAETLRLRLLEEELSTLGGGPPADSTYRPQVSRFSEMRAELQSLMRIIEPLTCDAGSSRRHFPLGDGVVTNLVRIRSRLSCDYREYDDFVRPIVGFIDCLFIAQTLSMQEWERDASGSSVLYSDTLIPFARATWQTWRNDRTFLDAVSGVRTLSDRLYWLRAVTTRSSILPMSNTSSLHDATERIFHQTYLQWRSELQEGQKQSAAKSSLYKYRGQDEQDDEPSEEELDELFPGQATLTPGEKQVRQQKAQDAAHIVAGLHALLFLPQSDEDVRILDLLLDWQLATPERQRSKLDRHTIPAFFYSLGLCRADLTGTANARGKYNIYKDSNIPQAKALVEAINSIKRQFNKLHETFPDHATPLDVLRLSEDTLQVPHSTPLAQLLPRVEKLHAAVTQWQSIASREYNVLDVLERLTSLIVNWRQLELSSWAGLFDNEWKQCEENAASWWYIAYESIIASASEDDSQAERQRTLQELLQALGEFMASSGLGEYRARLYILRAFEAHLCTHSRSDQRFAARYHALKNFNSFYDRYSAKVVEGLAHGRQVLEKEVKNVIQLASWKDRNVDTLRQSAQSSHRKLLRLVRKFRRLLAQPVSQLLATDLPTAISCKVDHHGTSGHIDWAGVLTTPIETIELAAWHDRPQRFRNVEATSRAVSTKLAQAFQNINFSSQLVAFSDELQEAILDLQKATPSILTDKNKALVKSLKTRKRRVLADVLRDLRAMGFQAAVSDDVLARQRTTSVVLANLPALQHTEALPDLQTAEHSFHRFLAMMPAAREGAKTPSDELTPAEVSRCQALLESILDATVAQHTALASAIHDLEQLQVPLRELCNFGQSTDIRLNTGTSSVVDRIPQASMLGSILGAAQTILVDQQTLSGHDYSSIIEDMAKQETQLAQVLFNAGRLPKLPSGLQANCHTETSADFYTVLQDVRYATKKAVDLIPEVEPVVSHVLQWAEEADTDDLQSTNGFVTTKASRWVESMLDILDRILVATQQVDQATSEAREKEVVQRLANQQSMYYATTKSLQVAKVTKDIATLASALAHLDHEGTSLTTLTSMVHVVAPIFIAYYNSLCDLLKVCCACYGQLSQAGCMLAKSFVQLCERGFCSPSEKSQDNSAQKGDMESGTGLGDGEGAEDISKDIGDDEDISELAQSGQQDSKSDIEDEKDAVDMADEDLEGELGEGPTETGSVVDEGEDNEGDQDVDEQAADEDIGPGAVDEKMWDEPNTDDRNQKEADSGKGKVAQDDNTAATEQGQESPSPNQDDNMPDAGQNEATLDDETGPEQQPTDQLDPHAGEEQNLELPDDIVMDGNKDADPDDSDLDSVGTEEGQEEEPSAVELNNRDQIEGDEDDLNSEDIEQEPEDNGQADDAAQEEPAEEDGENDDLLMQERPLSTEPLDDDVTGAEEGSGGEKADAAKPRPGTTQDMEDAVEEPQDADNDASGPGAGATEGAREKANDIPDDTPDDRLRSSFKQLGDIMEHWFDQHRDIEAAPPSGGQTDNEQPDLSASRFEHLPDEGMEADAQALGTAPMDQSAPLNRENAVPADEQEQHTRDHDRFLDDLDEEVEQTPQDGAAERNRDTAALETGQPTSLVGDSNRMDTDIVMADDVTIEDSDEVEDMDEKLTNTHLSPEDVGVELPLEDAQRLWAKHEDSTRNLALVLTEHLRLILHPTQATRMRGDFRTGKRLNIKRIIPYIASSYKRDKIWMRRSVPTKRSYQVMLAIDDSKSMAESDSQELAFMTLALIAKSMSMLEVGELSVVGFGEQVKVAHDFSTPFTSDAGSRILQQFTFSQSKTNVQRLLTESIEMFRAARLKAAGSASDLWQLQLIISDGICEDHPAIRQLIRQAHEERIMVVFIVVDPATLSPGVASGTKQSILDLQTAEFVKDAMGEMQLKMNKYLDTFPFRYYLIVRDLQDLPGVLAGALRQWFSETVDSGT